MSKWAGKYVIGLTGNIATGKSMVRRMLEHLGAYGIDADALAHRVMSKGAPGYQAVVDLFGRWVVAPDGEIQRARLGRIVFSDPEALAVLEGVIHPLVLRAVDMLIRRSSQPVVVVEAIKLIEAGMQRDYDSLWVSYAPYDLQLSRMMQNRRMVEKEARQRIQVQASQDAKLAQANVVIKNTRTIQETWQQVVSAWQKTIPVAAEGLAQPTRTAGSAVQQDTGRLVVERGRPRHSEEIAAFISQHTRPPAKPVSSDDIMTAFGDKAYLLLRQDGKLAGLAGWQVENLVTRTSEVYIDTQAVRRADALAVLIGEVEKTSRDLQCEVSLVSLAANLVDQAEIWKKLGYEPRRPGALGIQAWEEAALEMQRPGELLVFKQLRQDRVLKPI